MASNRLPHLLFYGPPGTGKTSTILAVARQIYGNSLSNMTLELNASDDRGIDVVRQEIQDFASTRTIFRCGAPARWQGGWQGGPGGGAGMGGTVRHCGSSRCRRALKGGGAGRCSRVRVLTEAPLWLWRAGARRARLLTDCTRVDLNQPRPCILLRCAALCHLPWCAQQ